MQSMLSHVVQNKVFVLQKYLANEKPYPMFSLTEIKHAFLQLSTNEPVNYAIPFFIVAILLELLIQSKEQKKSYSNKKDVIASLAMGIGSIFTNLSMKIIYFIIFSFLYQKFAFFQIPITWWSWLILLFADDFNFYWFHRSSHQVRILWAAHSNHHSSQQYNLAVALRQSWTEFAFKYAFWIYLPILGFQPIQIFMMISCSLIYQFFLHTESIKKLGFLELFMNTPSHHRVHHATNTKYLDRNHAGIFIIWDKIFGTFQAEQASNPPIYGLTENLTTYNPIRIASHEYEQIWKDMQLAKFWKDKINYLFQAPGWRHDGKGKTTKELQNRDT